MAAILDFSECPRVEITHPGENVILDPQGPESGDKKIMPDYSKRLEETLKLYSLQTGGGEMRDIALYNTFVRWRCAGVQRENTKHSLLLFSYVNIICRIYKFATCSMHIL